MRILFESPHVTLSLDEGKGLVRYARTTRPYDTLAELTATHQNVLGAVKGLPQRSLKLLLDSRDAPPRNDPAFEGEVVQAMTTFIRNFAAHAFLVKSAVGVLQTKRLSRAGGDEAGWVFTTEKDALRHLGIRG